MEELIKVYYAKYRENLIPVTLFFVVLVIVFRVIVPQISNIFLVRQEIDQKNEYIALLNASLNAILLENSDALESNIATVSRALPNGKEIITLFSALVSVAGRTDVQLVSFSLQVGELYGKRENVAVPNQSELIPSLNIIAKIDSAQYQNLVKFSNELYRTLPVAEVKKFSITNEQGNYDISFFYKPYNTQVIAKTQVVTALTSQEKSLLQELKTWE